LIAFIIVAKNPGEYEYQERQQGKQGRKKWDGVSNKK